MSQESKQAQKDPSSHSLSEEERAIAVQKYPQLVAQDKLEYNRLLKWNINLQKYVSVINEMKGGRVVMACGATGSGKSTLMNSFIQGVDNMDTDDDCNIIAKNPLMYNNQQQFRIGHEVTSCTQNPGFYKHKTLYFVDCPGLDDNDRFKEYPNQTCVHNIQKNAEANLIIYVIGWDQFVNRGDIFIKQMTGILRQISPTATKDKMTHILMPILVRYSGNYPQQFDKNVKEVIKSMKLKFIDRDEEYTNLFVGPSYPSSNEYTQFVWLCEIVYENYVCCDPMDDACDDFREEPNVREYECAQVIQSIFQKFNSGTVGGPDYFNEDLPQQLHNFLNREILYQLVFADNFQSDILLREEAQALFDEIFVHWEGEITNQVRQDVKSRIEIADEMGRNATFKWYVQVVSPILKEQASREGRNTAESFEPNNTNDFPMSCLLRFIALTGDIINELDADKFSIQNFHSGLIFLQNKLGKMQALDNTLVLAHPSDQDASGKKKIPFADVINKLAENRFAYEGDPKLTAGWVKQAKDEFFDYFQQAFPNAYQWRFYRRTIKWGLMNGSKKSKFVNAIGGAAKFFHNYKSDYTFKEEDLEAWTIKAAEEHRELQALMLANPDLDDAPDDYEEERLPGGEGRGNYYENN